MGQHVVFSGEILATHWTRVHLHVHFVRGHVMAAKVADVRVDAIADRASVQVVFLPDAKVPR